MTKPINPTRYITQSGVPGGEGTGDDLDPGTDGGSGAGNNNVGAGDEKSGAGKEKSSAGKKSGTGDEDSGAGDGSVGSGGNSVAKALIALQPLEVPEPIALTFQ